MKLQDHLYDNWKEILILNLPKNHPTMKTLRMLIKGNLGWMVRRLIGGIPSDGLEQIDKWVAAGEMLPPPEFTRRRRVDEDRQRKNKQHS